MCRVPKRETVRFEEAMEELKNKMLLLGHRDYGKVCSYISSLINEEKEKKKKTNG